MASWQPGSRVRIGGKSYRVSDQAVRYRVWLRRPRNPQDIGREALELVTTILRLSDGPDLGRVTQPVRDGWALNFAREGTSLDTRWADLADRTMREREFLGFPAAHPILQRTGSYKRSWVNRTDPNYFERAHRRGSFSGGNFTGGGNQVFISLGSIDYRVPTLSGGMEVPGSMFRDPFQATLGGMPQRSYEGMGRVPPRPVTPIDEKFADGIGRALDFLLGSKAGQVKARG